MGSLRMLARIAIEKTVYGGEDSRDVVDGSWCKQSRSTVLCVPWELISKLCLCPGVPMGDGENVQCAAVRGNTGDSNTRIRVYVSRDMVGFSSSRSLTVGLNICQLVASSMSQCPHRMNKQRAQLYTGGLLRYHPASTQNRRDLLTLQEDNATTQTEFIAIHIRVAYMIQSGNSM